MSEAETEAADDAARRAEGARVLSESRARFDAGDFDAAELGFAHAAALAPDAPDVFAALGALQMARGRPAAAMACLRRACDLDPDDMAVRNCLADAQADAGALEAAALNRFRAVEAAPQDADALIALAGALRDLGLPRDGLVSVGRALSIDPGHRGALRERCLSALSAGDYAGGFADLARLGDRSMVAPAWNGEPLDGKTVLLHADGPAVETVLLARFAAVLSAMGARCVLEAPRSLRRLFFEGLSGVSAVIAQGELLPTADYQCALRRLAALLDVDADTLPNEPYIAPSDDPRYTVAPAFGARLKVGLAWSEDGGADGDGLRAGRGRSARLADFAPLLAIGDLAFYSLQNDGAHTEIRDDGFAGLIEDIGSAAPDYAALAAVVAQLDLVIAVDGAVAHVAAAMGKPVWLAASTAPDWAVAGADDETSWHASMSIYRQDSHGDWSGPIGRMVDALSGGVRTARRLDVVDAPTADPPSAGIAAPVAAVATEASVEDMMAFEPLAMEDEAADAFGDEDAAMSPDDLYSDADAALVAAEEQPIAVDEDYLPRAGEIGFDFSDDDEDKENEDGGADDSGVTSALAAVAAAEEAVLEDALNLADDDAPDFEPGASTDVADPATLADLAPMAEDFDLDALAPPDDDLVRPVAADDTRPLDLPEDAAPSFDQDGAPDDPSPIVIDNDAPLFEDDPTPAGPPSALAESVPDLELPEEDAPDFDVDVAAGAPGEAPIVGAGSPALSDDASTPADAAPIALDEGAPVLPDEDDSPILPDEDDLPVLPDEDDPPSLTDENLDLDRPTPSGEDAPPLELPEEDAPDFDLPPVEAETLEALADRDEGLGGASVEDMMLYEPPPYTEGGFAVPPPTNRPGEGPPDPFPKAVPDLASEDVAGTAEAQDAATAGLEPEHGSELAPPPASDPPLKRLAGAPPPKAPALEEKLLPLPSALRGPRGRPRFFMPLAREDFRDPNIVALCRHEADFGGWRRAVRSFLDHHILPGDALIDVGAHWGVFAMSAATRWPAEVSAIAIEPEPVNVERLRRWIEANRLGAVIEVVSAAATDAPGNRTFAYSDGSMSHYAVDDGEADWVAQAITIDELLDARPGFESRRLFMKVDAHADTPAAIRGARAAIAAGRVVAILWTRGPDADRAPGRDDFLSTLSFLSDTGFTHHRLPDDVAGGALSPFVYGHETCTVFSLAADFDAALAYVRPQGFGDPRHRRPAAPALDPAARAVWTKRLMAAGGTDVGRWVDVEPLRKGAAARAADAIAAMGGLAGRLLDVGAGALALRDAAPDAFVYEPLDLVARAENAVVVDLNHASPPDERWDIAAALGVIEHLHDPVRVLTTLRERAKHLIVGYDLADGGAVEARRAQGYFNDFDRAGLRGALSEAGWSVAAEPHGGGAIPIFRCR